MIVAFTGHRPNKLGGYKLPNPTYLHVCKQIDKTLQELQPSQVISGMALGIDQWAANIAIKSNIPVLAAIPFEGQEKAWPQTSQDIYHRLLSRVSEKVIVCPGGYAAEKMQRRNEWMVDRCHVLIACFDGTPGGTGNCVKYAESVGRQIILIDPRLDKTT